jgi:hypothetical protein
VVLSDQKEKPVGSPRLVGEALVDEHVDAGARHGQQCVEEEDDGNRRGGVGVGSSRAEEVQ